METEVTKKLFTVQEYHRMGEAGILRPEDRVRTHRRRNPPDESDLLPARGMCESGNYTLHSGIWGPGQSESAESASTQRSE